MTTKNKPVMFSSLQKGDRFTFVNAAMFNMGKWEVSVPANRQLKGEATQGHRTLGTRWDRQVMIVETNKDRVFREESDERKRKSNQEGVGLA